MAANDELERTEAVARRQPAGSSEEPVHKNPPEAGPGMQHLTGSGLCLILANVTGQDLLQIDMLRAIGAPIASGNELDLAATVSNALPIAAAAAARCNARSTPC